VIDSVEIEVDPCTLLGGVGCGHASPLHRVIFLLLGPGVPGRRLTTVTIGTDGLRDWVQLPTGERYNLGTLSVLNFIAKFVPSRLQARQALDRFNAEMVAMVPVDLEAMSAIFVPRRARWSSASSLILGQDRHPPGSGKDASVPMADTMTLPESLPAQVGLIEAQIDQIGRIASANLPKPVLRAAAVALKEMVAAIKLPDFGDQSKNDAFYGLGAPRVDTADPGQKLPAEVTNPKLASHEALLENTTLAEGILQQVGETEAKIDQLVQAGRKFNAARAKQDLHQVSARLTNFLQDVDMAQPWVKGDLAKLANRSSELHALFATAKV